MALQVGDPPLTLVTGASGFIGQALVNELFTRRIHYRAVVRTASSLFDGSTSQFNVFPIGEIGTETDWTKALINCDCVIHCAGRAHFMNDSSAAFRNVYRSNNLDGTKQLAYQASQLGVRRLVFLSSIKVDGESTDDRESPFGYSNERIIHPPSDSYALSKWEAEQSLWEVSAKTGLEVVVIRLPLVYGPGVKGNLFSLLKLVHSRIPLPFASVDNKRSFLGVKNLIDALILCIDDPSVVGQTLYLSDGHDLSTPDLISMLSLGFGYRPLLFPVPLHMLRLLGYAAGRKNQADRLLGSLQIDPCNTFELLKWSPPFTVSESLFATSKWFQNHCC